MDGLFDPKFRINLRGEIGPSICRLTNFDRLCTAFAAIFLFLLAASAICAYLAIGEAPSSRMWGFFGYWALTSFAIGVAGPWLLCRGLHASVLLARVILREVNQQALQMALIEPGATTNV